MNTDNITSINIIIIMLLAVKSFEIFPKHNGYGFISDILL